MDTVQIGKIILANRKEKGVTQEELANHLGVSKPAVSKWESGQSYPDIMLLPVLAAYFDISVDQLIGYEPQMIKEDVRKLYHRLADDFAKLPFDQVYAECEEYIKKYFSCWYLQFQIALLYVNHCNLAGSPEKANEILERAVSIFERVEKSCGDVNQAKQALQLRALCYLSLQQPSLAIDILEDLSEPQMQSESLLIKAYQMKGNTEKAIEYLQGITFINLSNLLSAAPDFFTMYADQPDKMDSYYKIFMDLISIFEFEKLQPAKLYSIYLVAATVFVMQGRNSAALDALEKYVNLAKQSDQAMFQLHGSKLFDVLEDYLDSVDIETEAPRNAEVIWRDIKNVILNNQTFAVLETEPRFQKLKKRLEEY
jgi:transcriptional regulator with XRE-family HTH domain